MVVAGAGGVDHDELCKLTEQHFGKISKDYDAEIPLDLPCRYTGKALQGHVRVAAGSNGSIRLWVYLGSEVRDRDDAMPLAHVAIAVEGAGWTNPDNLPLMVANTLVGNWDRSMVSGPGNPYNLAKNVSDKNFCHSYQSFNTCYKVG